MKPALLFNLNSEMISQKSVNNRDEVGDVLKYLKDIYDVSDGVLSTEEPNAGDIWTLDNGAISG